MAGALQTLAPFAEEVTAKQRRGGGQGPCQEPLLPESTVQLMRSCVLPSSYALPRWMVSDRRSKLPPETLLGTADSHREAPETPGAEFAGVLLALAALQDCGFMGDEAL